jgi:hypothetical protein
MSLATCCITNCEDFGTAADDSVEEGLLLVVGNATKDVSAGTCD